MSIPYLSSSLLSQIPHVQHGFFTRAGGVSLDAFASLNGSPFQGDDPAHVAENRRRMAQTLGIQDAQHLLTLEQVHGTIVHVAHGPEKTIRQGDGWITQQRGLAIGILTADCVPVLLADQQIPVVGAVHAGWRSAFGNIVGEAVRAMEAAGAQRDQLVAALGPCIHQASYEVDMVFYERFCQQDPTHARWFKPTPHPDHWNFDLPRYVQDSLHRAGVQQVEILPYDTYTQSEMFFSHRFLTQQGHTQGGRQVSCISIL